MPIYERNEKGALVPIQGEVPEEAIMAIERADEQTIVERLTRADAQPWFAYAWPIKTKEGEKLVIGIGVDGAKEIGRQLGNIRAETNFKIDERDNHFYCAIPVTDLVRNFTWLGVASQSKYILGESWQPTERIDEFAFVKVINKAQRNGILAVAPQEAIANIIARLDPKLIKKLPLPPTYSAARATTTKGGTRVLKEGSSTDDTKLRQEIAIEWDKTGRGEEQRKDWQKKTYDVQSMTDMKKDQLEDMLDKVKMMLRVATELGYSALPEQDQKRGQLFGILKELGYNTQEKVKEFLSTKDIKDTRILTKSQIESLIAELSQAKTEKQAEDIPEDI